jgi:hypothetical protein
MSFIKNPETFLQEAREEVKKNLISTIGVGHFSTDPYSVDFISKRYEDLFRIRNMPSKAVILDYLADEKLTGKKIRPDLGAIACEFWGGIFHTHIESKKKDGEESQFVSINDFSQKLASCYALLASRSQIYSYASSSEITEQILFAFRKTSEALRIPIDEFYDNKVIRLVH